MSDPAVSNGVDDHALDVGDFCRRVEEHLARTNDGQIIRVVGPAFDLVRGWALEGIPLSVVFRGIELKAERHRAGRSKRPLRLEFCDDDVRETYENWRRAVGLTRDVPDGEAPRAAKSASLARHLERVVDRLSRVAGRLDLPDRFRDEVSRLLEQTSELREAARHARGDARAELVARLLPLDGALIASATLTLDAAELARVRAEAEAELAPYATRLTPDAWARTVDLGTGRLVREQLGLPTMTFDG